MSNPIFDNDDLSFFYTYGIGLHHNFLKQGLEEAKIGSNITHAANLAHFSYKYTGLSEWLTQEFQMDVELFVRGYYEVLHNAEFGFRDAAFLLLKKGDHAIDPNDYNLPKLAGYGYQGFDAKQVMAIVTTENDANDNLSHAVLHTMLHIKNKVRALKIQEAKGLLSTATDVELRTILTRLITCYEQNVYIPFDAFQHVNKLCKDNDHSKNERSQKIGKASMGCNELKKALEEIDTSDKKGEQTFSVPYIPFQVDNLSTEELKENLLYYIRNKNLKNVQLILSKLPKIAVGRMYGTQHPLVAAAACAHNTGILKALYDYDPNMYKKLQQHALITPLFMATRNCVENTQFFLNRHTISSKDLCGYWGLTQQHILSCVIYGRYDIIELLVKHHVDIGNEIKNLDDNPFASCASAFWEESQKIFELLLPKTNYVSKYLALASIARALSPADEKQGPQQEYNAPTMNALLSRRTAIIESLTSEECDNIKFFYKERKTRGLFCRGEDRLAQDLLSFETKDNKNSIITKNIMRIFGETEPLNNTSDTHPIEKPTLQIVPHSGFIPDSENSSLQIIPPPGFIPSSENSSLQIAPPPGFIPRSENNSSQVSSLGEPDSTNTSNQKNPIEEAAKTAQLKYSEWYKGQSTHRGKNGFFSWLRHREKGQNNARLLLWSLKESTVDEAKNIVNDLLINPKTAYHRHSFASFLLDELKCIQGYEWSTLGYIKNSNLYDQKIVKNCLSKVVTQPLLAI